MFQIEEIPSLKSQLSEAIEKAYPKARKLAIKDSKNAFKNLRMPAEKEYPNHCPFTTEEILNNERSHLIYTVIN